MLRTIFVLNQRKGLKMFWCEIFVRIACDFLCEFCVRLFCANFLGDFFVRILCDFFCANFLCEFCVIFCANFLCEFCANFVRILWEFCGNFVQFLCAKFCCAIFSITRRTARWNFEPVRRPRQNFPRIKSYTKTYGISETYAIWNWINWLVYSVLFCNAKLVLQAQNNNNCESKRSYFGYSWKFWAQLQVIIWLLKSKFWSKIEIWIKKLKYKKIRRNSAENIALFRRQFWRYV